MKSLLISSAFPTQGKTTIAVNLAVGLTRMGYRTMLIETGDPALLMQWFNLDEDGLVPEQLVSAGDMGFDLTRISNQAFDLDIFQAYDWLIIDTGMDFFEYRPMIGQADLIAVCTDLRAEDIKAIPDLDQKIDCTADSNSIALIIPTIINAKEWSHNSEVLFSLMERYGEDKIADLVPKCSAIYDLPRIGKHIWQLPDQYRNRRETLDRLLQQMLSLN